MLRSFRRSFRSDELLLKLQLDKELDNELLQQDYLSNDSLYLLYKYLGNYLLLVNDLIL